VTPAWGMLPVHPLPRNGADLLRRSDCPQIGIDVFASAPPRPPRRRSGTAPPRSTTATPDMITAGRAASRDMLHSRRRWTSSSRLPTITTTSRTTNPTQHGDMPATVLPSGQQCPVPSRSVHHQARSVLAPVGSGRGRTPPHRTRSRPGPARLGEDPAPLPHRAQGPRPTRGRLRRQVPEVPQVRPRPLVGADPRQVAGKGPRPQVLFSCRDRPVARPHRGRSRPGCPVPHAPRAVEGFKKSPRCPKVRTESFDSLGQKNPSVVHEVVRF
jgi:hypothetical protein